jgi:hypothetical protein
MKPWVEMSFFPGANTLFEGQQTNGQTHREDTQRREIKEATRDEDQGRSKQQFQRGTRTTLRHDVRWSEYIVNRDCSDDW